MENKNKLFNILNLIDNNINTEVNEVNEYINTYTKNFRKRRQYNIYYNLLGLNKNFIDSSMEKLRQKFEKIINDTILITVKDIITNNYDLAFVWLQEIIDKFISLHKRDEMLQSAFYTKYAKFVEAFKTFLPKTYSEESIKIYKKYFEKIRNEITETVRNKIKNLNYYYFNISLYENDFYFIWQINDEIEYLVSNLEKYYSEDYFEFKLSTDIYQFTYYSLNPINDKLYKKFENLKKKCERYSEGVRRGFGGDYCWNNKRVFRKWHYLNVRHTNNYKKLDTSLKKLKNL